MRKPASISCERKPTPPSCSTKRAASFPHPGHTPQVCRFQLDLRAASSGPRMPKRIMVAFGTRPECIKLAPVVAALRARRFDFETIVCSSGQQREMLDQALSCFKLDVDRNLDVMRPDQSLSELT